MNYTELKKYLEGKTSESESEQIRNWLKKSENEAESRKILGEIWTESSLNLTGSKPDFNQILHRVHHRINSEKASAVLQNENRIVGIYRIYRIFSRIAAILILPLLGLSLYFYSNLKQVTAVPASVSMHEIYTNPGTRNKIVLPDGSTVWLNAESTIRFKIPFDSKSRKVELTGEAFFDVKKDDGRPFQVESGKLNVTVLGTRFNCKAFTEDPTVEVVLDEGQVSLSTKGQPAGKELIMKPGERAVIDKTTNHTHIKAENIGKYIAWHTGKLVFDECPLPEVALRLERWFGIEVKIGDPKISSYRITTTFENEPLHQVLELLSLSSPIKIDYIPAKIDKKSQQQSKAKVIITRKK